MYTVCSYLTSPDRWSEPVALNRFADSWVEEQWPPEQSVTNFRPGSVKARARPATTGGRFEKDPYTDQTWVIQAGDSIHPRFHHFAGMFGTGIIENGLFDRIISQIPQECARPLHRARQSVVCGATQQVGDNHLFFLP